MARCIYCLKSEKETTFNREHVIPQSLGVFEPVNAVLTAEDGLVCKACNSDFSKLETTFKEDTEEGIFAQQLNLDGNRSVRIRGKRLKMSNASDFGKSFLKQIFPFLKVENHHLVMDLTPQIQIRNYFDGYQVYKVSILKKIKEDPKKNAEIKARLSRVKPSDVAIFTGGNSLEDNNLDEIITLLKDFGLPYVEGDRKFTPLTSTERFEYDLECTVDRDAARILAKIMFNYFALCALKENMQNILFDRCFDKIRLFINGNEEIKIREIIPSIDKDFIMEEEKEREMVLIAHKITFEIINDQIIGYLNLFGRRVYEVVIGYTPKELQHENMGCGHLFDPFSRKIASLGKGRVTTLRSEEQKPFGLFKKAL